MSNTIKFVICNMCNGSGYYHDTHDGFCPDCNGNGEVIKNKDQLPLKQKLGRPTLPYKTKAINMRLSVELIDRMNADKVNKTELITHLLTKHFADNKL